MAKMVKLVDSCFPGNGGLGLAHATANETPFFFRWDRTEGDAAIKVWTDGRLDEAAQDGAERKIALLLESPAVNPGLYEREFGEFDYVLTHQRSLAERGDKFLWYPLGGSWIPLSQWGPYKKHGMTSMFLSEKQLTDGHQLRHKVSELLTGIDVFGHGVGRWIESKAWGLRDYRYHIVIENTRSEDYFSEKLIDALAMGCIPIYWGCPALSRWFNMGGILPFDSLDELHFILQLISADEYELRRPSITDNIIRAQEYRCAEDWIWQHYPHLFERGMA
jgi:hypothetical protein